MADSTGVQVFVGPANQLELGAVVTGPPGVTLETISDTRQRLNLSIPSPTQELVDAAAAAELAAETASGDANTAKTAAQDAAAQAAAAARAPTDAVVQASVDAKIPPAVSAALAADTTVKNATVTAVNNAVAGIAVVRKTDSGIPNALTLNPADQYVAVEVDASDRVSRAVLPDGTQYMPKVQTAHATTSNYPTDNYLRGSVDVNGRMAEDFIGKDGRVPQWIIDAWQSRMNLSGIGVDKRKASGIICRGDSITAGAFGAGTSYPLELSKLRPDLTIAKRGYPGERSMAIAQRQGSKPLLVTVTSGSIAASSGTVNPVTMNTDGIWYGYWAEQGVPDGRGETGTLNGIRGTLSGGPANYNFTRTQTGEAYPTDGACPFVSDWESTHRDWHQIIMTGYNGAGIDTVDCTAAMVGYQTQGDFLVMSITTSSADVAGTSGYNARVTVNNQLASIYGANYFDLRGWLIANGLAAVGITPTTADNTAIAGDTLPPSLMAADGVHPNASGYKAIAIAVNQQITAKGWK